MADEVQFTDEQWEAVAKAAEVFGKVLAGERANLENVLTANWAGNCAEGEGTIQNLRELLRGDAGFAGAIETENQYLVELAAQCRWSKQQLTQADTDSATFNET